MGRPNREAQADAAGLGQIGQDTPFGSINYSGAIGSPNRRQTVTLNPQDQARLEQERSIKSRLLGIILGGQGGEGGGQGKQGPAQPMPMMNEPQPQGAPMPPPQPAPQQPMPPPQPPMGQPPPAQPIGPARPDEMMARYLGGR